MWVALSLLVVSPLCGQAPASVAGTICHYVFKAPGPLTPFSIRIAVLWADGTYADLRRAATGALTQGSYTYAKNSDSEGTLVTTADGGVVSTYPITFSSSSGGSIVIPGSTFPADTPLSDVRLVESLTGAFPLAAGSKDAAQVLWLGAGNYTVHVRTAAGEPRAEVLAEVYVIE